MWLVKAWFSRFSKEGRRTFQVSGSAYVELESHYSVPTNKKLNELKVTTLS